jgi:hypothetical protein
MEDTFDAIFDGSIRNNPETERVAPEPASEVEAPEVSAPIEPEAQPQADPIDEDGKGHSVPLVKFLDIRDDLKAERAARAELERQVAEYQRQSQPQTPPLPDPSVDPHGYADARLAEFHQQMFQQKLQICGDFAVRSHGQDKVEKAVIWAEERCKSDPAFVQAFRTQANPAEFIIEQHAQAETLALMQRDPVAYARQIAEQQGWLSTAPAPMAAPAVSAPTQSAAKPKASSLMDIPAASGQATVQSSTKSFDRFFNER